MYNFSGKINTMCKMAKFHQWTRQLTSAVDKTPTPPAPVCPLQPLRERQPLYSEQDSYHPVCPLYISNICERDNLSTVDKTPIPPVCLLYISNLWERDNNLSTVNKTPTTRCVYYTLATSERGTTSTVDKTFDP